VWSPDGLKKYYPLRRQSSNPRFQVSFNQGRQALANSAGHFDQWHNRRALVEMECESTGQEPSLPVAGSQALAPLALQKHLAATATTASRRVTGCCLALL
jgi:hypothetical protein